MKLYEWAWIGAQMLERIPLLSVMFGETELEFIWWNNLTNRRANYLMKENLLYFDILLGVEEINGKKCLKCQYWR